MISDTGECKEWWDYIQDNIFTTKGQHLRQYLAHSGYSINLSWTNLTWSGMAYLRNPCLNFALGLQRVNFEEKSVEKSHWKGIFGQESRQVQGTKRSVFPRSKEIVHVITSILCRHTCVYRWEREGEREGGREGGKENALAKDRLRWREWSERDFCRVLWAI